MWNVAEFRGQRHKLTAEGVQTRTLDQMEHLVGLYHGLPGIKTEERKACLRDLKGLAEFYRPNLNEQQERILAASRNLSAATRSAVLSKHAIVLREVAMKFLDQVADELTLIEASQDRWRRLRQIHVGERRSDATPVPGPLLPVQGNYQREVYDPRHRPWGQETVVQNQWSRSSNPSLFEFAGHAEYNQSVTYLSPTEAEAFRISFVDGKLHRSGTAYTTGQSGAGWDIFVMDSYGGFFVHQHESLVFHHSSFLAGGPVKGAGQLKVKNGTLLRLSDRSGHYKPGPEHMLTVVRTLKEMHRVPLEGVVVEMYRRDSTGKPILGERGLETDEHSAMSMLNG